MKDNIDINNLDGFKLNIDRQKKVAQIVLDRPPNISRTSVCDIEVGNKEMMMNFKLENKNYNIHLVEC